MERAEEWERCLAQYPSRRAGARVYVGEVFGKQVVGGLCVLGMRENFVRLSALECTQQCFCVGFVEQYAIGL